MKMEDLKGFYKGIYKGIWEYRGDLGEYRWKWKIWRVSRKGFKKEGENIGKIWGNRDEMMKVEDLKGF